MRLEVKVGLVACIRNGHDGIPEGAESRGSGKKSTGALFLGQKRRFWDRKVSMGPGGGLEGLPGALLRSVGIDFLRRTQP